MRTHQVRRQPAGTPAGGQYAPGVSGESTLELEQETPDTHTRIIPNLVNIPAPVDVALDTLRAAGMRPVLVGGSVRDALLDPDLEPKDLDFEVYGAHSPAQVAQLLRPHGRIDEVGVSFGVVKLTASGHDVDLTLPRRDSKVGEGHRGFEVTTNPDLSFEEASARRDFTINAIMWDPATGELIDPHGGADDLQAGVLRHVSDAFDDDPLRVLRGVQFAARFDMDMAPETIERCRSLAGAYPQLATERVWGEMDKVFSRGVRPSRALDLLERTGWVEHFPELAATRGTPQDPDWHPEGDVYTHLGLSADEAAARADAAGLSPDRRAVVVAATLLHDVGKSTHTQHHPDGRITSHGHAGAGEQPTRELLARMGAPKAFTTPVTALVREHMNHQGVGENGRPSVGAVRRLQRRLDAAGSSLTEWSIVVAADSAGRGSAAKDDPSQVWLEVADRLGEREAPRPRLLTGKHLIDAGMEPGPSFRDVLTDAERAQDDGEFDDEAGALAWLARRPA
ncbi:HD domain-containing protein [Ornithinimicrobium faecis]|uniref:HD domain-containing protein n=1 Tax=Ornithinimicrobium faecis TaxID=2934158 RepID=A0ABY4YZA9_9MICO|nr:HD domain-containing protein [Ornithinimicrobium sp. HY1793]USQ81981.1 HD domain-containing protein [Ornithinimicrobium sp. HY1793]